MTNEECEKIINEFFNYVDMCVPWFITPTIGDVQGKMLRPSDVLSDNIARVNDKELVDAMLYAYVKLNYPQKYSEWLECLNGKENV